MLFGRDVFADMLPVSYEESGIAVSGYAARPGLTRSSRREQRIFVNGRPAEANTVYFAIRDAYHTLVMKGRYPPAVLAVNVPPEALDVNVHPAKREVRFREDRLVGQVVTAALRRALRDVAGSAGIGPQPGFHRAAVPETRGSGAEASGNPRPEQPRLEWRPPRPGHASAEAPPEHDTPTDNTDTAVRSAAETEPAPQADEPTVVPVAEAAGRGHISTSTSSRQTIRNLRVLGTFADLYVVAEGREGLVLIDQHAAHERILFERLLSQARLKDGWKQPLLLPVTVELSPTDAELVDRSLEHFDRIGFGIEPFGGTTFLVTALPPHFPQENITGLLHDVLSELRDSPAGAARPDEIRIAQAACKHAVRAEDSLDPREIDRLLRDLSETEMPFTCPHGRPVMINIPHQELEKRFGRRL
jgi:DNA mismatch repair protein MutL